MYTIRSKSCSPIARWLLEYAEEQNTSLSRLAREAQLAPATLLNLVKNPDRRPDATTCAKLSVRTGKPLPELLAMVQFPLQQSALMSLTADQLIPGKDPTS